MMEETLMERLRRMADRVISERPSDRVRILHWTGRSTGSKESWGTEETSS